MGRVIQIIKKVIGWALLILGAVDVVGIIYSVAGLDPSLPPIYGLVATALAGLFIYGGVRLIWGHRRWVAILFLVMSIIGLVASFLFAIAIISVTIAYPHEATQVAYNLGYAVGTVLTPAITTCLAIRWSRKP